MISNPAPLHPGTVLAEIWVRMQRTKGSDSLILVRKGYK
jgi:hypothetical protein